MVLYTDVAMTPERPREVEKLPEGVYPATSDDAPSLVTQGPTIAETLEIARDVARKLIEAGIEIFASR